MCLRLTDGERAALVAELCRNLALLRRGDGDGTRVAAVLARYREVADAAGCRAAFEAALAAGDGPRS